MSSLVSYEEILKKVPTAHHEPKENCKYCGGTGMKHKVIPATEHLAGFEGDFPCMCIFVDHEFVDEMQGVMNETVRKMRKEMFGND